MLDDKRFATIRATLALHGIAVARTCPQDGPQRFYLQRNGCLGSVERLDTFSALERLYAALVTPRSSDVGGFE